MDFFLLCGLVEVQFVHVSWAFWTFYCRVALLKSKIGVPIRLFGLHPCLTLLKSPISRFIIPILDFLRASLRFNVQSATLRRSFWASTCLSTTLKSNPSRYDALFGLHPLAFPFTLTIQIPMHTNTNAISAFIPSSLLPSPSHHAERRTPNTGLVKPKIATLDTGLCFNSIPHIE